MTYKAMNIAYEAHDGQKDRSGAPYIFHPYHIAESMPDEMTACAALLHDTVEDTDITIEDLADEFPPEVVETVGLLTHEKGVPYLEYVRKLKGNSAARMIKLADLAHNSDSARLAAGTAAEEDIKRLNEKYASARAVLNEDFKLIAVTNFEEGTALENAAEKTAELLSSGTDAVVLRAKQLPEGEYAELFRDAYGRKPAAGGRLVWHAHAAAAGIMRSTGDAAAAHEAVADSVRRPACSAIQLPFSDFADMMADHDASRILPDIVGVSVHSPEEAELAGALGASYAVFGHVFPTDSKRGRAPRGLDQLRLAVLRAGIPVFAIGGIKPWNISDVRDSGCGGACIMSGFMQAPDAQLFVKQLREKLR